jgi:hypothetical protein
MYPMGKRILSSCGEVGCGGSGKALQAEIRSKIRLGNISLDFILELSLDQNFQGIAMGNNEQKFPRFSI